jgi:hypothetical protein
MRMTLGTSIASHAAAIALGSIAAAALLIAHLAELAIVRRLHRGDLREDISRCI